MDRTLVAALVLAMTLLGGACANGQNPYGADRLAAQVEPAASLPPPGAEGTAEVVEIIVREPARSRHATVRPVRVGYSAPDAMLCRDVAELGGQRLDGSVLLRLADITTGDLAASLRTVGFVLETDPTIALLDNSDLAAAVYVIEGETSRRCGMPLFSGSPAIGD